MQLVRGSSVLHDPSESEIERATPARIQGAWYVSRKR